MTRKSPISPVCVDVGAAAELLGEAGHLDHAHLLAVLVAEERERAVGERLLAAHRPSSRTRRVAQDLLVDAVLDVRAARAAPTPA